MAILANKWGKMTYYFRYNIEKTLTWSNIYISNYIMHGKEEHLEIQYEQWVISKCFAEPLIKEMLILLHWSFPQQGKPHEKYYEINQMCLLFLLNISIFSSFPICKDSNDTLMKKVMYI